MQTKYSILRSDMDRFFMASLLRQKVALEVTKSVATTKTEVWGRHILVADQKTAQDVLDQLKAGANWYDLAAKYSTDTSTKDNGGDLGWVYKGETVQAFEDALFALKPGETSGIVQSSFGFHIIQSLGTREVPLTADELSAAQQTAFSAWLTDSLSKATVKENNWKAYLPADVLKLYTQYKSGATTQQ
jgi:foldase protein PrsA